MGGTTGGSEKSAEGLTDHLIRMMFLSFSSNSNLIVDEFLERKHGNAICMLKSEMSTGSEDLTKIANT